MMTLRLIGWTILFAYIGNPLWASIVLACTMEAFSQLARYSRRIT